MKISDFISELQVVLKEHGDLDLVCDGNQKEESVLVDSSLFECYIKYDHNGEMKDVYFEDAIDEVAGLEKEFKVNGLYIDLL